MADTDQEHQNNPRANDCNRPGKRADCTLQGAGYRQRPAGDRVRASDDQGEPGRCHGQGAHHGLYLGPGSGVSIPTPWESWCRPCWEELLQPLGLLFLLVIIAAFVGNTLLGGMNFSSEAMLPKWSKLSPLSGFEEDVRGAVPGGTGQVHRQGVVHLPVRLVDALPASSTTCSTSPWRASQAAS